MMYAYMILLKHITADIWGSVMKWINLEKHGLHLCPHRLNSGKLILLIVGDNAGANSPYAKQLGELHFRPLAQEGYWFSSHYSRDDGSISGLKQKEFLTRFPQMVVQEMSSEQLSNIIITHVSKHQNRVGANSQKAADDAEARAQQETPAAVQPAEQPVEAQADTIKNVTELTAVLSEKTMLGFNLDGQHVYHTAEGRYIDLGDGTVEIEPENSEDPRFLRGMTEGTPSISKFSACAAGLVHAAKQGVNLDAEMIERGLAAALDGHNLAELDFDPQMLREVYVNAVHNGVNRALFSQAAAQGNINPALIEAAQSLYERRPNTQDDELHPVVALVASGFMASTHKSILLSSAKNNAALLALPFGESNDQKVRISTYDADWEMQLSYEVETTLGHNKAKIQVLDTMANNTQHVAYSTDFVLGHFSGGRLPNTKELFGIPLHQSAHMRAIDHIQSLRENGIAVVTFAADNDLNDGDTSQSQEFLSWVYSNFNVIDAFDVNAMAYRGRNEAATRMLIIAGRNLAGSANSVPAPVRLPVCDSMAALLQRMSVAQLKIYDPDAAKMLGSEVSSIEDSLNRMKNMHGDIQINEYQSRYIPMAKVGEATSLIPVNLQYPQQMAFMRYQSDPLNREITLQEGERIVRQISIEEKLAQKLDYTIEQVNEFFAPEQKDAIAMAIWREENRKPFIVGDATGVGKGRVLAAMARYFHINQKKIMFTTKSTDLLNDFWRDVRDIKADVGKHALVPYIVNDAAEIQDSIGNQLYSGSEKMNNMYINEGKFPPHASCLLFTYTQINRYSTEGLKLKRQYDEFGNWSTHRRYQNAKPSPRIDWLVNLASQSVVIADESHEASGQDSNIGTNLQLILERSLSSVFSSATFAANEKKLTLYRNVFPNTMAIDELSKALHRGGEHLQEVMSSYLVSDGAMIVRNNDLSTMNRTMTISDAREQNCQLNDLFAGIMMSVNRLLQEVDIKRETFNQNLIMSSQQQAVNTTQRKVSAAVKQVHVSGTKSLGLQSTGIGSVLQNICRQFVLAVNAESVAREAVQAVRDGQKPVIYMGQTGETLLKQLITNRDDIDDDSDNNDIDYNPNEVNMPLFRDALHRMVDNCLTMNRTLADGTKIKVNALSLFEDPRDLKLFNDALLEVRALIDAFPPLPFSPLDTIRHSLESKRVLAGELSGRKYGLSEMTGGGYSFYPRDSSKLQLKGGRSIVCNNNIELVRAFNSGSLDALLITNSGATGVSMHSSQKFEDQNQRILILAEPPASVIALMQVFGRVWRRGQVNNPEIRFSCAGIPSEYRTAASLNYNLGKMSSQTSANRDSFAKLDTKFDLLNPLGDAVVHRYLESRPDLIKSMSFTAADMGEYGSSNEVKTSSINSLSRRFSGRLIMLSTAEQESIYGDLDLMYQSALKEMELQGRSPRKGSRFDWKAVELRREIVVGIEQASYTSEFDRPIYLTKLQYKQPLVELNSSEVMDLIDAGMKALMMDGRSKDAELDQPLKGICQVLHQEFPGYMEDKFYYYRASQRKPVTPSNIAAEIQEELKNPDSRYTQGYKETQDVITLLERMSPGGVFELGGQDYVITKIVPPRTGHELSIGMWMVTYCCPGSEPDTRSLDALIYSKAQFKADRFDDFHPLFEEFNAIKKGAFSVEERFVLGGNLFKAADLCVKMKMGKPCSYSDVTGVYHQAMLMPDDFKPRQLLLHPARLHSASMAADYVVEDYGKSVYRSIYGNDENKQTSSDFSLSFMPKAKCFHVIVPKSYLHAINLANISAHQIQAPKDNVNNITFRLKESYAAIMATLNEAIQAGIPLYTGDGGIEWMREYEANQRQRQNTTTAALNV